jgi:hypothetical protein
MRNLLMTGWNFMRVIRLILGAMLLIQAIQTKFVAAGLLGGLLLFQAISNTGCCGAGGCAVPNSRNAKTNEKSGIDEIEYEEVK